MSRLEQFDRAVPAGRAERTGSRRGSLAAASSGRSAAASSAALPPQLDQRPDRHVEGPFGAGATVRAIARGRSHSSGLTVHGPTRPDVAAQAGDFAVVVVVAEDQVELPNAVERGMHGRRLRALRRREYTRTLTGTPIRICWFSSALNPSPPGAAGTSDPANSRMAAISFLALLRERLACMLSLVDGSLDPQRCAGGGEETRA